MLLLVAVFAFTACGTSSCSGKQNETDDTASPVSGQDSSSEPAGTDSDGSNAADQSQSDVETAKPEPIVLPIDPVPDVPSVTTDDSGIKTTETVPTGAESAPGQDDPVDSGNGTADSSGSTESGSSDSGSDIDLTDLILGGEIVLPPDDEP